MTNCICEWVEKQMGYKNVSCTALDCKNKVKEFDGDFRKYFKLRDDGITRDIQ